MSFRNLELAAANQQLHATVQPIGYSELDPPDTLPAGTPKVLQDNNPLHAVRATLTASVGTLHISVGELLAVRDGQVLTLDRAIDDPIDLMVEGRVVARAQLVALDGNFAVRITELPVPLSA